MPLVSGNLDSNIRRPLPYEAAINAAKPSHPGLSARNIPQTKVVFPLNFVAEHIMKIYLSGEIHTDWRAQIEAGCRTADLAVEFSGPVTDHDASDAAGDLLGVPAENFWRDHQSSR